MPPKVKARHYMTFLQALVHIIITFRHYSILNYPSDLKDCIHSHALKEQLYADDFRLRRAVLAQRSLSTWGHSQVEQLIMNTTDSITFPHTSCSYPHLCLLYGRYFLVPQAVPARTMVPPLYYCTIPLHLRIRAAISTLYTSLTGNENIATFLFLLSNLKNTHL